MNNSKYKGGASVPFGERHFAKALSQWQNLPGTGTPANSDNQRKRNSVRKVHLTHPVRMKPGIWIFRNTRLWIMLSFISIQWWIILYSIADSKQLYNNYLYIILFASIFDLVNIGSRDSPI